MTHIEVLGPGCSKCKVLYEHAEQAAEELGLEYEIEKVTDIRRHLGYGVMATPALIVDGEVEGRGARAVGRAAEGGAVMRAARCRSFERSSHRRRRLAVGVYWSRFRGRPPGATRCVQAPDRGDAGACRPHRVIAYYFHTTYRCASCRAIEAYSREAIESAFAAPAQGRAAGLEDGQRRGEGQRALRRGLRSLHQVAGARERGPRQAHAVEEPREGVAAPAGQGRSSCATSRTRPGSTSRKAR